MRAVLYIAAGQARWALVATVIGLAVQVFPALIWRFDGGLALSLADLLRVAWPRALAVGVPTALALHAVSWRARGESVAWRVGGQPGWLAGAVAVLLVHGPLLLFPVRAAIFDEAPAARLRLADAGRLQLWRQPLDALQHGRRDFAVTRIGTGTESDLATGGLRMLVPVGAADVLACEAASISAAPGTLQAGRVRVATGQPDSGGMRAVELCGVQRVLLNVPKPRPDLAGLGPRELPARALRGAELRWRAARAQRGDRNPAGGLAAERVRRLAQWILLSVASGAVGLVAFAGSGPLSTRRALSVYVLPAVLLTLFGPRLLVASLTALGLCTGGGG